jgi:phospholipase C
MNFLSRSLPVCLSFMMVITPVLQAQSAPATTTPIQHVVVIFQENVSFDH